MGYICQRASGCIGMGKKLSLAQQDGQITFPPFEADDINSILQHGIESDLGRVMSYLQGVGGRGT